MSEAARPGDGGPVARLYKWLESGLRMAALVLGGASLAFLVGLGVVNVLIMRKVLNAPIRGAEDLMVLTLVVVVAIAIPYGGRAGAHIEIEVLENAMSDRFARCSLAVMKAIGCAILAVMAWRLWIAGTNAAGFGESSQTLVISFAPFYGLLAISVGLYALVMALEFWLLLRGRATGRIAHRTMDP